MEQNGISKLDVKRRNRMQILRFIRYSGPQSRIDISVKLKLTRAAVTIITNEMISQGIIYEKGEETFENKKNTRGRRKVLLDICCNYKLAFGVSIEKDKIMVGLTNLFGETLDRCVCKLDGQTYIQLLELISENINKLIKDNWLTDDKILGIGVCVSDGGYEFIDEKTDAAKLKKLRRDLSYAFSYSVYSGRTIDGAALAQLDFDKNLSHNPQSIVVVRFGQEIDATATIGNVIYMGSTSNSCGIKKLQQGSDGLSSYQRAIAEIKKVYSQQNTPYLYEQTKGDINLLLSGRFDYEACKKDYIIKNILDSVNLKLATDLYTISTVIDCERMWVFGNYIDNSAVLEQVNTNISNLFNSKFEIEHSLINEDTLFLCGAAMAVQEFFVNKGGFDS